MTSLSLPKRNLTPTSHADYWEALFNLGFRKLETNPTLAVWQWRVQGLLRGSSNPITMERLLQMTASELCGFMNDSKQLIEQAEW